MNFIAQKDMLMSAIGPALRAAAKGVSNAVLETFLIKAVRGEAGGTVFITSYDLEKGVKCEIPAVVKEEGSILISSSKFSAIVNNMSSSDISVETDDRLKMKISCANSMFEINGISAEMFPTLPELSGSREFGISQGLLKRMIKQTSFAASYAEGAKPFMSGVFFLIKDGKITLVGCDGYRLAYRVEDLDFEKKDVELRFIVPAKTLNNLAEVLSDSEEAVRIQLSNKHIIFITEDFIFFSRLIDGEYMDYERAIPKDQKITMRVKLSDLIDSIGRVALIVDQRAKSPVRCIVGPNFLKMTCVSANGVLDDEIKTECKDGDLEIGFNHVFLKEAFERARDCGEEYVDIEMTSPHTGITIKPVSGSNFLYFVLPVRLQN